MITQNLLDKDIETLQKTMREQVRKCIKLGAKLEPQIGPQHGPDKLSDEFVRNSVGEFRLENLFLDA